MNKKELKLSDWNRREHYEFFSGFDEPFFGIVSTVNFTKGYQKIKDNRYSYFLYYLHKALQAANAIEAFRYRIEEEKVYIYDQIHASPTIGREDHTFGFSFMTYQESFEIFQRDAQKGIDKIKNTIGLCHTEDTKRVDTIHFSSIPWYNFTGLSHARHFKKDSVPKISFGKYTKKQDEISLPIAINVHHGLIDGYHVGLYLEEFQRLLNK